MIPPTDDDGFPADFSERIERVCSEAADGFRACPGDLLAQLRICARYFQHGEQEGMAHEELIDYLGISAHSVLDRAGYGDDEALRVMKGLPLLNRDKNGIWQPPDALPSIPIPPSITQLKFNLEL